MECVRVTTPIDSAERPERTHALRMLAAFLLGAAVIPGVSIIALLFLVRAIAAGWAPLVGGAVLAASWPLVTRAWQDINGGPPPRFGRLPGWVWLGAGGALVCALLLA